MLLNKFLIFVASVLRSFYLSNRIDNLFASDSYTISVYCFIITEIKPYETFWFYSKNSSTKFNY